MPGFLLSRHEFPPWVISGDSAWLGRTVCRSLLREWRDSSVYDGQHCTDNKCPDQQIQSRQNEVSSPLSVFKQSCTAD